MHSNSNFEGQPIYGFEYHQHQRYQGGDAYPGGTYYATPQPGPDAGLLDLQSTTGYDTTATPASDPNLWVGNATYTASAQAQVQYSQPLTPSAHAYHQQSTYPTTPNTTSITESAQDVAGRHLLELGAHAQSVVTSAGTVHNAPYMISSNQAQAITQPYATPTDLPTPLGSTASTSARPGGKPTWTASRQSTQLGMSSNDPRARYEAQVSAVDEYTMQQAAASYPTPYTPSNMSLPPANLTPDPYYSPTQAYSPLASPYAHPHPEYHQSTSLAVEQVYTGGEYAQTYPQTPRTAGYMQLPTAPISPQSPPRVNPFHPGAVPVNHNMFRYPREDSDHEYDDETSPAAYSRGRQLSDAHLHHHHHAHAHQPASTMNSARQTVRRSASVRDQSPPQPASNSPESARGGSPTPQTGRRASVSTANGDRRPFAACLFCRGRKIACSLAPNRTDGACSQCIRRNLKCEYPAETKRGVKKTRELPPLFCSTPQLVLGSQRVSS